MVNRVSAKKLADMQKQLPFVPLVNRSFYQDLIKNAAKSDIENSEKKTDKAVNDTTQCSRHSRELVKKAIWFNPVSKINL